MQKCLYCDNYRNVKLVYCNKCGVLFPTSGGGGRAMLSLIVMVIAFSSIHWHDLGFSIGFLYFFSSILVIVLLNLISYFVQDKMFYSKSCQYIIDKKNKHIANLNKEIDDFEKIYSRSSQEVKLRKLQDRIKVISDFEKQIGDVNLEIQKTYFEFWKNDLTILSQHINLLKSKKSLPESGFDIEDCIGDIKKQYQSQWVDFDGNAERLFDEMKMNHDNYMSYIKFYKNQEPENINLYKNI
jgi:hypothetical protein